MNRSRDVIVIGAGMLGVATAQWLRRAGHRVTLIDRVRPGADRIRERRHHRAEVHYTCSRTRADRKDSGFASSQTFTAVSALAVSSTPCPLVDPLPPPLHSTHDRGPVVFAFGCTANWRPVKVRSPLFGSASLFGCVREPMIGATMMRYTGRVGCTVMRAGIWTGKIRHDG